MIDDSGSDDKTPNVFKRRKEKPAMNEMNILKTFIQMKPSTNKKLNYLFKQERLSK